MTVNSDSLPAVVNPPRGAKPVDLNLACGLCLLRKISLAGVTKKELESALQLWAEESLPAPVDQYYLYSWEISTEERGLAALPRKLLSDQRGNLWRAGKNVAMLRVPELCPPSDRRPGIVLWPLASSVLVCVWREGVLIHWQNFPFSLDAAYAVAQLATETTPQWVMFPCDDTRDAESVGALEFEQNILDQAEQRWPQAECYSMRNWEPLQREQWFGRSPVFDNFLNEHQYRPATASDKMRLALAVAGVAVAASLLITSDLQLREAELEIMRQHDAVTSTRARRSELVASRSGKTLQQVYDLRALTVERNSVLDVLREVADALPPGVRFEGFLVDRNGKLELEGSAETELDISTLLQRLGNSQAVSNPVLAFAQKGRTPTDNATPSAFEFRIEMWLPAPLLALPEAADGVR